MGKSSGYCFKIISCGTSSHSDSVSDQNKGCDKRGWIFRKRSTNTEPPPSSQPLLITQPRVSTLTTKDDSQVPLESAAILIQAAVRKFLAQTELTRQKKGVVKLQAVVRGHLVRCRAAGTLRCIQAISKMQVLVRARHADTSLKTSSVGNKGLKDSSKSHPTYISIEKLLSNRFAIQLLESTPRTKQINIKCDPSNEDLAWKWMERWTSVSSPEVMEPHELKDRQEKVSHIKNQTGSMNFEQKSDFISDDSKHLNTGAEITTLFPEKLVAEAELHKRPVKRVATEQADSEGRKSEFVSRKGGNPAFIAAHSRFEELTSKNNPLTSVSEHAADDKSLSIEPPSSLGYESLRVGQSRSQSGGSECGTELSITSMLDSPDPSEVGNVEYKKESKALENEEHALLGTELTHSIFVLTEKNDDGHTDISQVKQTSHEEYTSNTDIELEPETGRQLYKSPETSPRSRLTASEPQRTPSSEISNNNKTKTDRKLSSQKPKSWSYSKKPLVSTNHGSSLRNSLDNLPRETKTGNRRNSFGSQSSELIDQEPRDSSSSNYIPSYMQVTESARAKALVNNSPKSSPDVQDKEAAYMKKRHSLPGALNGRHSSSRVKQTSPQAQQTTKGKDKPERKWQN